MRLSLKLLLAIAFFFLHAHCYAAAGGGGASPYIAMNPPFVVNVSDGEKVHHLQLSLSFVPTDPEMGALLTEHEPAIRHTVVVLLSGKLVTEINSSQGKLKLREEIQQAVNQLMVENTGHEAVKRILFTGFLIQ